MKLSEVIARVKSLVAKVASLLKQYVFQRKIINELKSKLNQSMNKCGQEKKK